MPRHVGSLTLAPILCPRIVYRAVVCLDCGETIRVGRRDIDKLNRACRQAARRHRKKTGHLRFAFRTTVAQERPGASKPQTGAGRKPRPSCV